jgi:hypothetical protein
MEWIDINEKQPELGQDVLVASSGFITVASLYKTSIDNTVFYFEDSYCEFIMVEFWMPLPEYPQTKKIEQ